MSATVAGIVGVAIGTLLNFLLQWLADIRRWRREDRIRFQADKLRLYRNFLDMVRHAFDIRYCDDDMSSDLNSVVSEIGLISSKSVSNAAENLVAATKKWCETGYGWFKGDDDEVEERKQAYEEAKANFHEASRVELRLSEESVGW